MHMPTKHYHASDFYVFAIQPHAKEEAHRKSGQALLPLFEQL
jgi:hypothetical protein